MRLEHRHLCAATLAAGFFTIVWGFQAMLFSHAPSAFRAPEEDMSFAWFVPLFSLYVLWTDRERIAKSLGRSSWAGFAAMLPFLAIGFLGTRGVQLRLEIVAFAGLFVAWPWAVYGRRTAARLLFPAMFLLFCIPLATFLDVITVHLRLFTTGFAFGVLKSFGVDVARQGTMLTTASGFAIDVAEPCSGLRSIFALMALTAGYAYFNQPTWLRRAALFACSVPLAIAGNVMRILTICLVAECADAKFALGFYHDYSGYVVFIVAISLMVVCGEAVTRASVKIAAARSAKSGKGDQEEAAPAAAESAAGDAAASRPYAAFAAFAVLAAVMVYQATTPEVTVTEAPPCSLPDLPGFDSFELGASEAELTVLPKDTRIEKRRYVSGAGDWFLVTLVVGGTSKSSIHRPELCLPAQGFLMVSPRTVNAGGIDWRFIDLKSGSGYAQGFAYTFFNQEGYRTSSHVSRILRDVVDRSLFNRIDRWVMLTLNCSRADDALMAGFAEKLKGVVECSN